MLANVRCASGIVRRSWSVTTPPCTAVVVSIGCVVIEDALPRTVTLSCTAAGWSVTVKSWTPLTTTVTFEVAGEKFEASTVTRYTPGGS